MGSNIDASPSVTRCLLLLMCFVCFYECYYGINIIGQQPSKSWHPSKCSTTATDYDLLSRYPIISFLYAKGKRELMFRVKQNIKDITMTFGSTLQISGW